MAKIRWLGHAAFVIELNNKIVLIDPWISNPLSPYRSIDGFTKDYNQVDLIIVTHDHGDHVGDSIELLKIYTNAKIVALYELAEDIAKKAKAINRSISGNIGGPIDIEGISLVFTDAKHSSTLAHPSGVVILSRNFRVYHAGDTGVFLDMKLIGELYNPTVALLPIGGWFTMGIREAVKAVELIKPKYVIPMHYNTFDLIKTDPKEFLKLVREKVPDVEVIILHPGEKLEID
ncbi:MAG: metal-dependent hydrolase [Ignisphaera sp.]